MVEYWNVDFEKGFSHFFTSFSRKNYQISALIHFVRIHYSNIPIVSESN